MQHVIYSSTVKEINSLWEFNTFSIVFLLASVILVSPDFLLLQALVEMTICYKGSWIPNRVHALQLECPWFTS